MRNRKTIVCMLMVLAILLTINTNLSAEEQPIVLRYASFYPQNHTFSKADVEWIERMKKDTNGRLIIKPYWAATLISRREAVADIAKGVCDIGMMMPSYGKAGFDIHRRMYGFYYGVHGSDNRRDLFKKLLKMFPKMAKEYESVHPLMISTGGEFHILTTKKRAIRKIDDLKGLQIKATTLMSKAITSAGGVGVDIPMGETYIALQKGIVDGCLAPYETLKSFRFAEVVKYVTAIGFYSNPFYMKSMNHDSYNKLPLDIQKTIDDSRDWWSKIHAKYYFAADDVGVEFGKQHGVEFIKLPQAELEKMYDVIEAECIKSVAKIDAMGNPGTAIFNEIRKTAKMLQ